MLYLIGFLAYVAWLVSLVFRWPVLFVELLICWMVGATGFLLVDRQWPAFDKHSIVTRRVWFALILAIGVWFAFTTLQR